MEPRAIPAATRGTNPCPHSSGGTTKPDSKIGTEHQSGNTPEHHKHLKSLVLGLTMRSAPLMTAFFQSRLNMVPMN